MPNLQEIKARQARLGSPEKVNYLQFSEDVDDFYRNAPTDIDWLVQEVESLRDTLIELVAALMD